MSSAKHLRLVSDGPIVLVEDEPVDVEIFEFAYKRAELDFEAKCFLTGESFFEYLEKVKSGEEQLPSVILLVINLGTMDGLEILEKIRGDEGLPKQPRVIMLSSSEQEKDVGRAKELGCDGYQVKFTSPVEYTQFLKSLI